MKIWLRSIILLAFSWALAAPALSEQVTATKLDPIDEWLVERQDGLCTITRHFGRREKPTRLQLRNRDPWNGGFHVAISSDSFALVDRPFSAAWLPGGRFATSHRPSYEEEGQENRTVVFKHGLWDGETPSKGSPEYKAYWSTDKQNEFVGPRAFKSKIESFFVNGAFEQPLLFMTGPMHEVLDARDQCIDEMLIAMGIDPAVEDRDDHLVELINYRQLANRIIRRIPSSFFYAGNWGGVSFLVFVDAEGKATSCALSTLPYDPELETFGCNQLNKKGKFRFKDGEAPQPAFYKLHVSVN